MEELIIHIQSYIVLLPDKDVEPELKDIKCRINKAFNHEVLVKMKREVNDENTPYSELVLQIDCEFGTLESHRIIQKFCGLNIFEGIGECRLSFEKAFSFDTLKFRNENIKTSSFSFGSVIGLNTFVEHYNSIWSKMSLTKRITQLQLNFLHDFSKIELLFIVANKEMTKGSLDGKSHRLHILEILYSSIQMILVKEIKGTNKNYPDFQLFLQLSSAPIIKKLERSHNADFIYKPTNDHDSTTPLGRAIFFGGDCSDDETIPKLDETAAAVTSNDLYCNKPTLPVSATVKKKKKKGQTDSVSSGIINNSGIQKSAINEAMCSSKTIGMCRTMKFEICGESSWEAINQLINCCNGQAKVFFTPMQIKELRKVPPSPSLPSRYFDCFYALKCIISSSYIVPDELYIGNNLTEVNKILKTMAEDNHRALEQTLFDIYRCLDKGHVIKFQRALPKLFDKYKYNDIAGRSKADITGKMVEMRRAVLTPTRFILLPPVPQLKSCLLRTCDTDYVMRVTARDDNFDQLTFTICGKKEIKQNFLKKYIGAKLAAGFKIGDRNYEFLGSSTSQLREHGSFFYAKDVAGRTARSLRDSVGYLSETIKTVPKFMARMGQSLSQAMTNIILKKEFVEGPAPDITVITNGKKYNFIFKFMKL